jgi:TetR/AcrR family transcriptional regulator, mexJK operon transcriptional repressor
MLVTAATNRSEHKRQLILDAGQALFLSQGFQGTSVDQIAARAQVSKQTVYKQFGDKRQLLFAIVSAVLDSIATPVIERIIELAHTTELESDLVQLAVDYLHAVLAEPVVQLRRLVIAEANRLPDLADIYYQRAPARTLAALADAFRQLGERGLLNITERTAAAEQFAFLVVGKPLDHALFYGGSQTLAGIEPLDHARAAVRVFLAAYRTA